MNKKVSMREQMPQVAAIIDAFREAFGAEVVDAAIRRGMRGGQGFHATENGHEVGKPVYRGMPLDTAPGRYLARMGEVAWQAALDQQAIENEKRG
ncbi:hypothetical protein JAB5_00750 [Janthinobacterium sp. HH103]|uniref:hypothetical protein n=1 Tax=unclassified Janthinobacterium TaxID=2610881 RepID=UPI000874B1EC|nr:MULTISPECIES: hypothetical protein [unclassified Janthinobacterium]OEZ66293.1 hypothetical protein JAB2_30190 [Janthinobacterium sp. HH100]OEZ89328.1 hypothetical protein JAB5_00750 [Janthinobacterium sp. HH103]